VTARIDGSNLVRHFKRATLASRRVVLRALGAEVARLHRAGYIHGDLTPYNIFVTALEPPRFVFIDHERTRRTILSRFERPRMRNLVQLGHLEVAGVTNTDRMRVWTGYCANLSARRRRLELRRVAAMLVARNTLERKGANVAHRASSSFGQHREVSGS
jgi:serine/threonine protein kinase